MLLVFRHLLAEAPKVSLTEKVALGVTTTESMIVCLFSVLHLIFESEAVLIHVLLAHSTLFDFSLALHVVF
jgi:hypothetical protein